MTNWVRWGLNWTWEGLIKLSTANNWLPTWLILKPKTKTEVLSNIDIIFNARYSTELLDYIVSTYEQMSLIITIEFGGDVIGFFEGNPDEWAKACILWTKRNQISLDCEESLNKAKISKKLVKYLFTNFNHSINTLISNTIITEKYNTVSQLVAKILSTSIAWESFGDFVTVSFLIK